MSSYDITFCDRECDNNKCERNKKRLKGWIYPVSMAYFNECKEFKETKNATDK